MKTVRDLNNKMQELNNKLTLARKSLIEHRDRLKGQANQLRVYQESLAASKINVRRMSIEHDFVRDRVKKLFGEKSWEMIFNTTDAPTPLTKKEMVDTARKNLKIVKRCDVEEARKDRIERGEF